MYYGSFSPQNCLSFVIKCFINGIKPGTLFVPEPRFEHEDVPKLVWRPALFSSRFQSRERGARVYPSLAVKYRSLQQLHDRVLPAADEPTLDRNCKTALTAA